MEGRVCVGVRVCFCFCVSVRASVEGVSVLCAHVSMWVLEKPVRESVYESVYICERDLCECECVHVSI